MFKRVTYFIIALLVLPLIYSPAEAKERRGEVTFQISVEAPEESKDVRLWIPYPVSDKEQTIADVKIDGNYSSYKIYDQKQGGDRALYAEWTKPAKEVWGLRLGKKPEEDISGGHHCWAEFICQAMAGSLLTLQMSER